MDDQTTMSVQDQVSAEEWKARCDLAALYRLVRMHGWDDLFFTHISMRVPGPEEHFLLNPFGLLYEDVTASNLVKVDLDGNVLPPSRYGINPAGFTIHSAIHAAREDVHVALHLHSDAGVAVAAQKGGLRPISQLAMNVYNDVAYHGYEGIALEADEKERLVVYSHLPTGACVPHPGDGASWRRADRMGSEDARSRVWTVLGDRRQRVLQGNSLGGPARPGPPGKPWLRRLILALALLAAPLRPGRGRSRAAKD